MRVIIECFLLHRCHSLSTLAGVITRNCHIKDASDFHVQLLSWFLYKVLHDKSLIEYNVWELSILKKRYTSIGEEGFLVYPISLFDLAARMLRPNLMLMMVPILVLLFAYILSLPFCGLDFPSSVLVFITYVCQILYYKSPTSLFGNK